MGNQCLKDNTKQQAQELHQVAEQKYQRKNRQPSSIGGVYYQNLQSDRNQIIRSKQQRNRNDIVKLDNLKQRLREFETAEYGTKMFDFKHRKYTAQIEALQKIIKTRQQQIDSIKRQLSAR